MSVYATWLGFADDEHEDDCAKWIPATGDDPFVAIYSDGRRLTLADETACTCRCGPIFYQGSHILPTNDDERRGVVHMCAIPAFVPYNRSGEDYPDDIEDKVLPWLRLSVNQESVVLDHSQVLALQATMTTWLERVPS